MGLGELFSLLSALAWAFGVILYRRLGESLPPLTLNFLKNLLVMGMVIPAVPLLHGLGIPDFTLAEIGIALLSGAVGIALADTLYFRALNELGAGRMGIIGNLYSPFVILLSFLFLGERLSLTQLLGFVLVSGGVALVARARPREADVVVPQLVAAASADAAAGHDLGVENLPVSPPRSPTRPLRGVALGVLAIALMAVAIVMVKRVLEAHPLLWVTLWRMLGALLGLLLLAVVSGRLRQLTPRGLSFDWRLLLLGAFVGQFLSMVLWLGGYKFTQASIAAILNETSSVFIVLLAWLMLREPLGGRGALGVALTLGGVALMLL